MGSGWSYVYVRGSHLPPTVPRAAHLKINISQLTLSKGDEHPITVLGERLLVSRHGQRVWTEK